jgi:hypothetical protein
MLTKRPFEKRLNLTRWGLTASACLWFLASPPAKATSRDGNERAAKKACLSGNIDKGLEILSDLYIDYKEPIYIYNQGRCCEQGHRYEDAISHFREYLLKASELTEAERVETEKHIATCQAYLGKAAPPPQLQPAQAPIAEAPRRMTTAAAAAPSTTTESNETIAAAPARQPAPIPDNHAGQLGAFVQFERVLIPGVSCGVGGGFEIGAGAQIGYYKGTWLGLRYLLPFRTIKPGLVLAMPLFIVDGKAVTGVEGSAIAQWDFNRHLGIYASVGMSYFPRAASDLGSLWFIPGVGVQVRL